MCLILFALQQHADYPFVIAANRDEYYQRPTKPAHFWPEAPALFAGKDMQAGGTWMGITRSGRFAAVTNYRDLAPAPEQAISRGELCKGFLDTNVNAEEYLTGIDKQKSRYAGFNLLAGNAQQLFYYSNRQGQITAITPGVHGLSNGLLNDPWPKVDTGKTELQETLKQDPTPEALHHILLDRQKAEASKLPETGLDLEKERLLSSRFIHSRDYGTRSTTVLRVDHGGKVEWLEQCFDSSGASSALNRHTFSTGP